MCVNKLVARPHASVSGCSAELWEFYWGEVYWTGWWRHVWKTNCSLPWKERTIKQISNFLSWCFDIWYRRTECFTFWGSPVYSQRVWSGVKRPWFKSWLGYSILVPRGPLAAPIRRLLDARKRFSLPVFASLDKWSVNESSRSNHFEITGFCLSAFTVQSASVVQAWNGCSQNSRFPTAGQGERRLWERDWQCVSYSLFSNCP